ncbi:MAG: FecR domain-containing protein [Cyclobacteriaceae bacterium]
MNDKLAKYFSGDCSQDEIEYIESWRSDSSDNSREFFEAKNIWIAMQSKPAPNTELLHDILEEPKRKEVQVSYGWLKYAAAAVVVLGLAFAINLFLDADSSVQTLADGSEISLHGESTIESINITDEIREVTLTGKAYFDIERDETRPFVIVTENARVEVLGTSFVIDATNEKTEVCVESGLVALIKPGIQGSTDLSVKLSKGEMGTVNNRNKGIIKKNNSDANYLAWKTKTLTFEKASMASVETVLEDVYGIDIEFENEALKNCNLTAKFKERRAKDAIEIIAKTFNLSFDFKDGKVLLKGRGC